ncbi:adenosylcobinamide-GDP ribazoletransferase [Lentisphaera profundi]|uniref:Adenosylcobinamide-GDP ribazoletransferase n=1 Tax=Lentisphaera profundi TaxID=1658616 RepID=A0ABY7VSF0_9BACT|nr:adenosylcobinamide-GDP ribazoletransferase [Lentisphaera profundi]WDE97131.1 adenosylcobinamide-GDP ribazoletransferase [Lentisphaera profundi]
MLFLSVLLMIFSGRCSLSFHMFLIKAKSEGLGNAFWNPKSAFVAIGFYLLTAFVLASFSIPLKLTLSTLVIVILSNIIWARYVKKHIDYGSGDTLGAACELGGLTALISIHELVPLISRFI